MFISSKVALQFLKHSKLQTFVIILGIAVGVSVQIFIGLLSSGLENTILNKIAGNSAQVTVYSNNGSIENWSDIKNKIVKEDKNVKATAPVVDSQVFIKLKDTNQPVQIRGFMPEDVNSLYNIKGSIYEGKMYENSGQVIIGKDLKKKLDLKLGDNIDLFTMGGKKLTLNIVGFFDLGAAKVNGAWVITDLSDVQNLIDFGNKATSIEIAVKDIYNADLEGKKVTKILSDNSLNVQNWKDQNKFLASGMVGEKICTIIIQFFVLLAAVLSIISILGISVVQKYKQIGILKAMGIKDGSAAFIFFVQAFILGVLGTALGLLFTWLYIKGFNRYIVNSEGLPLVNIVVNHKFILASSIIDIAASTFAALFPAFKSFRLNPVEVIKNG
ncbi:MULTISPECIES: ABC transporter permease [Clostridium]|uniref:Lipoprotein-releasing system transmembrane protein LolE n=2 Tax=Clostridium TaxID=1485 RepID=A0A166STY0_9CLOT|nr:MULTISPECIES: ABC transporter permease [Clostridium]AGY76864.1 ABC transporter permease [Clostridium autoethanogenum DSM 10061]ALU37012.1 MacB-like periplasmic core domain containing FtsX-like permease family protein [Clostridium autoethanogenum DSM 10061]OAA92768.1 Lipoprotein-releasing system transmembrane protein LolE [Clostridium coskatii]OBR92187.1 lipoprotein-releasing system transmembrane protein LolE [Clostridium coskatii]OVY48708.1 Lipoprotein-releasing system transmembrane protein